MPAGLAKHEGQWRGGSGGMPPPTCFDGNRVFLLRARSERIEPLRTAAFPSALSLQRQQTVLVSDPSHTNTKICSSKPKAWGPHAQRIRGGGGHLLHGQHTGSYRNIAVNVPGCAISAASDSSPPRL